MKKITILFALLLSLWQLIPAVVQAQTVDFRKETIYFLMTTRFFDGDPTNNRPNEWCSYPAAEITDPNDVTWKGDFKGLIQKLDYIKDLGFTAIWITPIVQNAGPLDYHGYHAYDFTKVDPRLESPGATFQDLINAVHAKGMKIVLDIVTNHSGRYGVKGKSELKYNTDPTQVWGKNKNGTALMPNPTWSYDGMTPNPDDNKIWSRANIPKLPAPYNANLATNNWPGTVSFVDASDPNWFHHSGNGFAQGWDDTTNLYQRALAGDCPDLNTGNPAVRQYLIDAYSTFIRMGVDAFRWDTIKHMNKQDVNAFIAAFKAVNPNLFLFGEVAQKRHELHNVEEINPHWYTWKGAVGSSANSGLAVIDFYAEATFHNIFEDGGSLSGVTAAARYDNLYSDASTNVTWLDNHDFGPNNDWNRRFGGSPENLAACMNFMFTWRGIPTVYAGTEMQFMRGAWADIHEASDINRSLNLTGRAYYGDAMAQAPNHRIYQHIKKLNAIRKAVPALQNGTWRWDGNGGGNAVGYVRKVGTSEVAVGLAKDGGASFSFSGLTNGIYRDAVTGKEVNVTGGTLSFSVTPSSAGIYVLNGPGMIGANGVGYFEAGSGLPAQPSVSITPAAGQYESAITVTITATRGTIRYTTDGTTPTASSPIYSAPFALSTNKTVKAIAIDGAASSPIASNTYTFGPIPGLVVHFKKPSTWATAYVHYWTTTPANALPASTWPGVQMTDEGGGWFKYKLNNVTATNLLFNDNGGTKTLDLTRAAEGWYKDGVWFNTNPDAGVVDTQAPTLSFDPLGGSFVGTVAVTVSANDLVDTNPTLYYTTDGTVPTAASTSARKNISFDFAATTTVKVFAKDASGNASAVSTQVYTVTPVSTTSFKVHFKKPTTWATAYVYTWKVVNGATVADFPWPGKAMTAEAESWYAYTVSESCKNIIFSNNGATQTPDLSRCGEGWYTNSTWYGSNPDNANNSIQLVIHFKKPTAWTSATMYFWQNIGGVDTPGTTWPGVQMVSEGNGWFKYTIVGASNCSNIIFSNNGASKSIDLNRCNEGWYNGTAWSNTNPDAGSTPVSMTVHFQKPTAWTAANTKIYFWNVSSGQTTTWPGAVMTDEGTGWFKYTFTNASCANFIFNNNGASQSIDLSNCGDAWYNASGVKVAAPRIAKPEEQVELQPEVMESISAYPNPATTEATFGFYLDKGHTVSLELFDLVGNSIAVLYNNASLAADWHKTSLNVSSLKNGVYVYRFTVDGNVTSKRLLIQR